MTKRNYILICLSILLVGIVSSCRTRTQYVPVESIRTEYRDKLIRDSIFKLDSVFVDRWRSNDTVYLTKEKYKYIFKDKLKVDTVCQIDTIRIPYPVTEYKEVNRLSSIQSFQIWCGRILLLLLFAYFGVKGLKRFI